MVSTGAPSTMNTSLSLWQAVWRKEDPAWAMCRMPDVLYIDHDSDFNQSSRLRGLVDYLLLFTR